MSANAGDLYLVCFQDHDRGSYVGEMSDFNKAGVAALGFQLTDKIKADFLDTYTVQVSRKSLFKDYTYELTRVSLQEDLSTRLVRKIVHVPNYGDIIPVFDSGIECQVYD